MGISDYQDDKIPDLKYADRDAEAFAAWLRSPAGGNALPENIQLLLNKEATKGKVAMALDWLLEKSKEGDRAIIYFSGHGDVEKKLFNQPGYLLCGDAPPVVYMSGGTLSVTELQEVVTTLSLIAKAKVFVITDACRAGTLAGTATGGPQQTTVSLMNRFANEVKILSCQPNEFSIEGDWGGGRGAFSYHLEDALYGLADRDKDRQIKLKEIGRYLEDHVPAETDPHVQNPLIIGDLEALVASVDEGMLAQWEAEKAYRQPAFFGADMRGIGDLAIAQADSNIQQVYKAFLAAVEAGELMSPEGKSANDYYEMLIHEPSIEALHGLVKRNFVAALVDEAQQVTNKLLKTDPFVVSDTWSRPFVFDHIPAYLERATEILGPAHFIYKHLKAKQLFFEAKTCLPDKYPELPPDSVVHLAVHKYEEALRYDSLAAYAHVELGFVFFYKLFQQDRAWSHAQKALEFSPNWVYALYLAGNSLRLSDPPQSVYYCLQAIELDSNFLLPYQELSLQGNIYYRDKFIQKVKALLASDPEKVPVFYRTLLGAELWRSGRLEEAKEELLIAEALSKGQDLAVYQYLGVVYAGLGQFENGIRAAKKQIELSPYNPEGYTQLAGFYKHLNRHQETIEILEKIISLSGGANTEDPFGAWYYAKLGEAFQEVGRLEEAKTQFQKALDLVPDPKNDFEINMKGRAYLGLGYLEAMQRTIDEGLKKSPGNVMIYYQAGCLYSLAKQEQKSLEWLEQALEKGFDYFGLMQADSDLDNVRDTPGFRALLKKYFPEQVKD